MFQDILADLALLQRLLVYRYLFHLQESILPKQKKNAIVLRCHRYSCSWSSAVLTVYAIEQSRLVWSLHQSNHRE
jgi:hypothetical protein